MPARPGRAEIRRVWRRPRSTLPDEVRGVLAAADLAAERTAVRVRLAVLILIGVLLAALGSLSGVYRGQIALIFALNAGVSVAAVVLARPGMFRSWVPWAVATLDAAVVLGVMIYGDLNERMSASYTPALAVSWTMFVLLGLTAMRFKPGLVLYLGGLFVCGMALVIGFHSTHIATMPIDLSGADLARLFGSEHNGVAAGLRGMVQIMCQRRLFGPASIACRRAFSPAVIFCLQNCGDIERHQASFPNNRLP